MSDAMRDPSGEMRDPSNEGIVKTWTIEAVSDGEAPLRYLCEGRRLTESGIIGMDPTAVDQLSPVQYLLLSVAGCFALSCRAVLRRQTAPSPAAAMPGPAIPRFDVSVTGDKLEGGGNRLSRISVVTTFPDLAEADAAATLHHAQALCTVTNTLSGSPAIHYAARSGLHPTAASRQGVDLDVQGAFSRR